MDEVLQAFRYLSTVRTPFGIGIVQGYLTKAGEVTRVLVSHEMKSSSLLGQAVIRGASGPATLTAYPVDVLEIMR